MTSCVAHVVDGRQTFLHGLGLVRRQSLTGVPRKRAVKARMHWPIFGNDSVTDMATTSVTGSFVWQGGVYPATSSRSSINWEG
jgi:hypothetical protein